MIHGNTSRSFNALKARLLLVALIREGTPRGEIYSSSFPRKHNLGSASSVQRAVERLLADEVLERVNGAYEFTDIFFKHWIQREFGRTYACSVTRSA
jgi:hypothetical protein